VDWSAMKYDNGPHNLQIVVWSSDKYTLTLSLVFIYKIWQDSVTSVKRKSKPWLWYFSVCHVFIC